MSNIYLISNDINIKDNNFIKYNGDFLYLPFSNLPIIYYPFDNIKNLSKFVIDEHNIYTDNKSILSNYVSNIDKSFKPYNSYNISIINIVILLIWLILILIFMRILYIKYSYKYSYILVGIIILLLAIINLWYLLTLNQNI